MVSSESTPLLRSQENYSRGCGQRSSLFDPTYKICHCQRVICTSEAIFLIMLKIASTSKERWSRNYNPTDDY